MHARAIYNALTQGRTVQRVGRTPTPGKSHPGPSWTRLGPLDAN